MKTFLGLFIDSSQFWALFCSWHSYVSWKKERMFKKYQQIYVHFKTDLNDYAIIFLNFKYLSTYTMKLFSRTTDIDTP